MKSEKSASELGFLTKILYKSVRSYQYLTSGRPSPCKYVPTCSNYALDALESHGAVHGTKFIFKRLFRCHPFNKSSGWDPVPGVGNDTVHLHEKVCS